MNSNNADKPYGVRCNSSISDVATAPQAQLCQECNRPQYHVECYVCSSEAPLKYKASLCADCNSEHNSNYCAKCGKFCGLGNIFKMIRNLGKWLNGTSKSLAFVCISCGYGSQGKKCARMKVVKKPK